MKLSGLILACLSCVAVAPAFAQHPVQIQQLQPSAIRPIAGAAGTQAVPSDLQLNTAEAQLKRELAELRRENERLKSENAACGQRVANFTVPGGSEVHAYCSAETTSMNTTGASADCGRYDCEKVTGTCRTQCAESDQCGPGYQCDADQRCKTVEEIQRANDQG